MRYGTPYKGSKSRIAKDIVDLLPPADCFVDLFAGGCAVTHAAMLSGKYKRFIINDIDSRPIKLFNDAVNGKFENEKRWISREDFYRLKDNDGYVAICWSFGNNCENYLYSKEIEPWKCALHFAALFNDFSQFENIGVRFDEYPPDNLSIDERMRWFRQNIGEKQRDEYCKWYLENIIKLSPQELDKALAAAEGDLETESEKLRLYLCDALEKSGLKQSEVDKHTGVQMSGHWFGRSQWAFPTYDFYKKLQEILPLDRDYFEVVRYYDGLKIKLQSLQRLQRLQSLQRLQRLQSLQSLQSLQRLQRLQSLQRLETHCADYQSIEIPENAVIYCDIPYRGTEGYGAEFDYERFYNWARKQKNIYISEYNMPDDFKCVWEKSVAKLYGTNNKGHATEKLFTL